MVATAQRRVFTAEELRKLRLDMRQPIAKKVLRDRWVLAKRHPILHLKWFTFTLDQHDSDHPVKPFPYQRPYIQHLVELWQERKLLTVLKARQMIMTWLFVTLGLWDAVHHEGRLIMLQSKREEDAIGDANAGDGLLGRATFEMNFMPGRAELVPGYDPRTKKLLFRDVSSTMWAIPQGGPIIRQRTASGVLSDEAAFQPEFGDAHASATPCIRGGGWFVALTTPDLADGGAFRRLHEDRLDEDG